MTQYPGQNERRNQTSSKQKAHRKEARKQEETQGKGREVTVKKGQSLSFVAKPSHPRRKYAACYGGKVGKRT